MEERISGFEDQRKEMFTSVKDNVTSKKTQAQNSKKIWDTTKRENSQIRMKEG